MEKKRSTNTSEKLRRVLQNTLIRGNHRCPAKEGTANALNMQNLRFGMKRRKNNDNQNILVNPQEKKTT